MKIEYKNYNAIQNKKNNWHLNFRNLNSHRNQMGIDLIIQTIFLHLLRLKPDSYALRYLLTRLL